MGRLRPGRRGVLRGREARVRGCAGSARGGDQLRGLPHPPPPLLAGLGPAGDVRRAHLDHGVALLPDRLHDDGGRFSRGPREPHRGGGDRVRAQRRGPRGVAVPRPGLQAGQRAACRRGAGCGDARPEPLAAARPRQDRGAERHPGARQGADLHRPALGARRQLRDARVPRGAPPRPGARSAARESRLGRCVQGDRGRRHPLQQRPRPGRRRHSRRQPGRSRWQHTGDERRRRPQRQPGDRPSLRSGHRSSWRLRARAGRVLGGRPQVGDPARPLEHASRTKSRTLPGSSFGSGATARRSTGSSGT